MWSPKTWEELNTAVGVQLERADLDFKRELSAGSGVRDIAKDVAAMAIGGGVIVVGVDESEGVASAVTPIELGGAVERVQQVIDGNVRPPLVVEITPLRENDGDDCGVLVISVPESWSAPHQCFDRFPARGGSTTRYLDEREIEALYRRRSDLRGASPGQEGVLGHQYPPGVESQVGSGVGLLKMHLRPVGGASHPAEPHLYRPLGDAVATAAQKVQEKVKPHLLPRALDLTPWTPAGSRGWKSGQFIGDFDRLIDTGPVVGGMYGYGRGFSLTATLAVASGSPGVAGVSSGPDQDLCAFEHLWISEVFGLLEICGEFFAAAPETALLRVDLELGGLLGAVSYQASREIAFHSGAPTVVENIYQAGGDYPAQTLARDPGNAVRDLLDPFMVGILQPGTDIVEMISRGSAES